MKKYRQHTEEFKRTLIERIDKGEITKATAARENNLSPALLDRWREQIHEGTMTHRPSLYEKQLEKELDKFKKKVGELTVQIDLLKKLHTTYPRSKKSAGYIITGRTMVPNGQDAP